MILKWIQIPMIQKMKVNDRQCVQYAGTPYGWLSMKQSGHFRVNKKMNIRLRICLVKKEKAKVLNIFLSILVLNQV